MKSDEEMRKEALRLAGIMADAAIRLVGGGGLNGKVFSCTISNLSACADTLRQATEDYNRHMIDWNTRKGSDAGN